MQGIEAFPLAWPQGWQRTEPSRRRTSTYKVTLVQARDECFHSLHLMGVREKDVVLSSNAGGLSRAEPSDPGVAVYWSKTTWSRDGNSTQTEQRVIACDKWLTVRENLRAVGLALEALRTLERTGSTEILNRAFVGFAALPPGPTSIQEDWRRVLGITPEMRRVTKDIIDERYRQLSLEAHPDRGGSHEAMVRLNAARDAALNFLRIG